MRVEPDIAAPRGVSRLSGWRGVALVAITYIYFLIFAQFGFLRRLDEAGLTAEHLRSVMGCMAAAGIAASLLVRYAHGIASVWRLRLALAGCSMAALLALLPLKTWSAAAIAVLIGVSLGTLTVTLVADLGRWLGGAHALMKTALGTGLGYFVCNVPALFNGSARLICMCAAAVCACGVLVTLKDERERGEGLAQTPRSQVHFGILLAWFTALVWLDSAAFFIIQSSGALKAHTWSGDIALWRNAVLHLVAALGSGWILWRRSTTTALLAGFACLAAACLLLLSPWTIAAAAVLYPVGVSFYSVVLVAAPSFLLGAHSREERERAAGWIYAVAGWGGSALGIGMAQNLHRVPPSFVLCAGLLFALPLVMRGGQRRTLQIGLVAGSLVLAALVRVLIQRPQAPVAETAPQQIALGRQVYIAEGCIHCHSQYIRPHSPDVALWGPSQPVEEVRRQKPPLIGNRRQGPDLSEVGARRSALWLRIHFINPRDVSYDSIMPSFASLFRDGRGNALAAYVSSLHTAGSAEHLQSEIASWTPSSAAWKAGSADRGKHLFQDYCATCHLANGRARQRWGADFRVMPPNLESSELPHVKALSGSAGRAFAIAKIIKFGVPGTDMPGHEYLSDDDIVSLAEYVDSMQRRYPAGSTPR